METYLVWDNDEGGFLDGWASTTDADNASHFHSLRDANECADAGDNRIVLEWK